MAGSKQCPKCSGSMVEGFVIDRTHGGAVAGAWVEGQPQGNIWTGVRMRGRPKIEIASWRCSRCGFLENYATGGPSRYEEAQKKIILVVVAAVAAASAAAITTGLLIG